jgi:hypothetical protein
MCFWAAIPDMASQDCQIQRARLGFGNPSQQNLNSDSHTGNCWFLGGSLSHPFPFLV